MMAAVSSARAFPECQTSVTPFIFLLGWFFKYFHNFSVSDLPCSLRGRFGSSSSLFASPCCTSRRVVIGILGFWCVVLVLLLLNLSFLSRTFPLQFSQNPQVGESLRSEYKRNIAANHSLGKHASLSSFPKWTRELSIWHYLISVLEKLR